MKHKFGANVILIVTILCSTIHGNEEDPEATLNTTNDNLDSHYNENNEQIFSSSTISEKTPDPIGMPQPGEPKPHPHQKHKNPTDSINSHSRSPVYEVITQPCYSPGCGGGFGPQDAVVGSRWHQGRNRFQPYPNYEPRRRGGYRDTFPGYGPNYGPQYPDYGYGPRGMAPYPRDRVGSFGRPAFDGGYGRPAFDRGYGRPMYDDYFLG